MKKFMIITFLNALVFIIAGCASPLLESIWCATNITIDGKSTEWDAIVQYSDKNNKQVGIGLMNDEKYLYVCIVSNDRDMARQALLFGFTATFKPKSGHGKGLGIHYPIGMAKNGRLPMMRGREEETGDANNERFAQSLVGMEIIDPKEGESRGLSKTTAESFGIHVCILPSRDNFVYEMQIPLNADSVCAFAIGAGNDSLVKVRLETSKPDMGPSQDGGKRGPPPGMGGQGGGMPPQGGSRGGGGGMPPTGGGMGPGGGGGMPPAGGGMGPGGGGGPPQTVESFTQEFTLQLAKKPNLP